MFIDETMIVVKAGDGGDGVISFRREKFVARGGPDGGHGGSGGSIHLEADPSMTTLQHFVHMKHYRAENGKAGSGSRRTGKSGDDLILKVPVGTMVFFQQNSPEEENDPASIAISSHRFLHDLDRPGELFLAVKGGRGGKGNSSFAHSLNQSPRLAEKGQKGEEKHLFLELKVLADVGLVGFPNAGKSTLLGKISRTHPKIGDYPFTTLFPQLGQHQIPFRPPFTVADIPGIIQGASQGKGLGIRFLKHIERCRMLLFLVDLNQEEHAIKTQLQTLFDEVTFYNPSIKDKQWVICGNKIDTLRGEEMQKHLDQWLQDLGFPFFFISAKEGFCLEELMSYLADQLEKMPMLPPETRPFAYYALEEEPLKIEKINENLYRIYCVELERIVAASDLHHPGSLRYISRMFKKFQVEKMLNSLGIKEGDMVEISGKRLNWI